jgi:hypothetical protein
MRAKTVLEFGYHRFSCNRCARIGLGSVFFTFKKMHPFALPSSRITIAIALTIIAACSCAPANQEPQISQIAEALSFDNGDGTANDVVRAPAAAPGDDEAMSKWARTRMQELQQDHDQQASKNTSRSSSSPHENLDFRSMLRPDSASSVASPEDIRNLFYSDAARAEVPPPFCFALLL